ncbi:ribosome small subunit-dependent GTPase A [bacterium]|nr:ribosome small subunit-dependent GTPase A [bacterium]
MSEEIKQGRVLSIRGKYIHILQEGEVHRCYLKNSFRRQKTDQKNTIAIGDLVLFNTNDQITEILERKTLLQRKDPLNPRKRHILGANIDRVYITFAVESPKIDIPMVDRYVMAALKGGLTPIIVLNKIDLLKDKELITSLTEIYKELDIEIFPISTYTKEGIEELTASLHGHLSIFSGPTGVGKTSLINIIADKDFLVGEISAKIQKGKHTTTYSSLIALDADTFIIDTPGIASFELFEMTKNEALSYFADLNNPLGPCKFRTCSHTHEPSCMVKEAEKQNLLSPIRLASYQNIIENI